MSAFMYRHIPIAPPEDFVSRSSAELEQAILDAIEARGHCTIGLSGGTTPRAIYKELGSLVVIPWEKVTIFLVDERYVPADDDRSNGKLVRETLLVGIAGKKIPSSQIFFPDTSLPIEECVEEYDDRIKEIMVGDDRDVVGACCNKPLQQRYNIDLVVLGLGEDGHIASLFPGDRVAILEEERFVLHTVTDRFAVRDRITVTMPVLTSASQQFFFLQGAAKEKVFQTLLRAAEDPLQYPAHALLATGRTAWVTTTEGKV